MTILRQIAKRIVGQGMLSLNTVKRIIVQLHQQGLLPVDLVSEEGIDALEIVIETFRPTYRSWDQLMRDFPTYSHDKLVVRSGVPEAWQRVYCIIIAYYDNYHRKGMRIAERAATRRIRRVLKARFYQ
jgi:hypothetical protein